MPFPSPGDLPTTGIEPRSPALQADALPSDPPGKPQTLVTAPSNKQRRPQRLSLDHHLPTQGLSPIFPSPGALSWQRLASGSSCSILQPQTSGTSGHARHTLCSHCSDPRCSLGQHGRSAHVRWAQDQENPTSGPEGSPAEVKGIMGSTGEEL